MAVIVVATIVIIVTSIGTADTVICWDSVFPRMTSKRWNGISRKAGDAGDVIAQYHMGICYETGIGVRKNSTEAFNWFLKAAKQNDAYAQLFVAKRFAVGHALPQYLLGNCYYYGCEGLNWLNRKD